MKSIRSTFKISIDNTIYLSFKKSILDTTYTSLLNLTQPLITYNEILNELNINLKYDSVINLSKSIENVRDILIENKEEINIEKILSVNYLNLLYKNSINFEDKCLKYLKEAKKNTLTNLLISSVIGAFLADSMGGYCEFKKGSNNLFDECQVFNGVNKNFGTSAGQLTDDSEMALCLGYGIIDNLGLFNYNKVAYYYSQWFLSGPFDIGTTTRKALYSPFKNVKDYNNFIFKEKYYSNCI